MGSSPSSRWGRVSRPELDRTQSKRKPFGCDRETRMHQNSANRVIAGTPSMLPPTADLVRDADRFGSLPLKRELRRVVQDKNDTVICRKAIMCRPKMTRKNILFTNALVGEKAIGRLGIRPILAGNRNAFSHGTADLPQQADQPSPKPDILKFAVASLLLYPIVRLLRRIIQRATAPLPQYHEAPSQRFGCSQRNHNRFIRFNKWQIPAELRVGQNVGN
jgi:hypothetical protein